MSEVSFKERISVPSNVMFRELEGESVILDVDTEKYFGLDDVGTRMWVVLTQSPSIQAAFDRLQEEYEVEPGTLRRDLEEILQQLIDRGLVEVIDS